MLDFLEKNKCSGCFACASKCPENCIEMICDNEGFWYPHINKDICVSCGLCKAVCPVLNSITIEEDEPLKCYAAYNNDDITKDNSSSGGIFTLLAEKVLSCGGVIFGAAFTHDFKAVEHIAIQSIEELPLLRGSKYLQSKIGDAYVQAKQYLSSGRTVLFSGTPCQIGGLYAYLGKDYENLITQDVICHGVPSPKVWKKYVEFREVKAASKSRKIFFRNKKYGWKRFSVHFVFENCKEYLQNLTDDLYMRGFLANLYLRPSCYNCSFKAKKHISDITLADFWGIEKIDSTMYDPKGTSLVIINTDKGENLFAEISNLTKKSEDLNRAIQYNPALIKSAKFNHNRKTFFDNFERWNFQKLINKCIKAPFKNKIKKTIKKILAIIKK